MIQEWRTPAFSGGDEFRFRKQEVGRESGDKTDDLETSAEDDTQEQ